MSQRRVDRLITLYERTSDALVTVVHLTDEEFNAVRLMLGRAAEDTIYDCYPLDADIRKAIHDVLQVRLPIGDYNYFLESEEV